MLGNSKDKFKSLIVANDRSFRSQTVRLFNDLAFAAEKIAVGTREEACAHLNTDMKIENVIINGEEYEVDALKELIKPLVEVCKDKPLLRIIVYLSETQPTVLADLQKTYPKSNPRTLPLKKADFLAVFHTSRAQPLIKVGPAPPPPEPEPVKRGEAELKTFTETTEHLRSTLTLINAVIADHKNIQPLLDIGQRFNGLVGTFAILKAKDGYRQIFELSTVIDDVIRSYQKNPDWKEIKEPHIDLIVRAVKCCFIILKELRSNSELSPANIKESQVIFSIYSKMPEIDRRSGASQDDVDALFKELGAG